MALPARDAELVRIVDGALRDATVRAQRPDGGSWLACRAGCTPCCHGVFRISALDAERLRDALGTLALVDGARAQAVMLRAEALREQLGDQYPGEVRTGLLDPEEDGSGRWDEFADLLAADVPCPVLDPETGRCELYDGRPLTCRVFGPPVAQEGGIATCELCYVGATEVEVLAGEMQLTHEVLEAELDATLPAGETTIAWALKDVRGAL